MDETRRLKVKYLERCSFWPGSYEKRFVRDMASRPEDEELSIRQAHFIDVLYWKYRKQIAAMSGTDKPEVFRPGELMVDEAVESEKPEIMYERASRRQRNQQRKAQEAQERLDEWNANVMGVNRDADPSE